MIETEQKLPCWFVFNFQNLDATLQNIHCFCPSTSTMLINTYRISIELFIDGEVIYSREGTTKGDLWQCQCMSLQLSHCSRVSLNLSLRYGTLTMQLPWALSQIFVIGETNLLTWTPVLAIIPTQLRHGWYKLFLPLKYLCYFCRYQRYNITSTGLPHLGASLVTPEYITCFVTEKVNQRFCN